MIWMFGVIKVFWSGGRVCVVVLECVRFGKILNKLFLL